MARHLGDLEWSEVDTLFVAVETWLNTHRVSGSIFHSYSLYRAIEDEWFKARRDRTLTDDLTARPPRAKGRAGRSAAD